MPENPIKRQLSEAARIRDAAVALDARRQKQVANQVEIINRLLDGDHTYETEMQGLVEKLSAIQVAIDEAIVDVAAHEKQESGPAEYRTANSTWRDVTDLLEKLREQAS